MVTLGRDRGDFTQSFSKQFIKADMLAEHDRINPKLGLCYFIRFLVVRFNLDSTANLLNLHSGAEGGLTVDLDVLDL